ncbi:hypothetical protein XENTR_v10015664 [Xenopus tropicalis]|nr:hypothetical protein XENTR_v10015664 [Xenopus tropicalis]
MCLESEAPQPTVFPGVPPIFRSCAPMSLALFALYGSCVSRRGVLPMAQPTWHLSLYLCTGHPQPFSHLLGSQLHMSS